jgi:hypothetical protein
MIATADRTKKRLGFSLLSNGLILLIEAVVITNCAIGFIGGKGGGVLMFRFFTEDSNILLGFSCLFYLIFGLPAYFKNTAIPTWIKYLRFIAVVAVMTTFSVVLLYLFPATAILYQKPLLMWSWPNMVFTHFFCPLFSLGTYVAFEETIPFKKKSLSAFYGFFSVVPYAIIVGSLASGHYISSDPDINNVYGFMDATAGKWYYTPLAIILILGLNYLLGFLILLWKNKLKEKRAEAVA